LKHGSKVTGTIHENGDLTWSHGPYTSTIVDNCPEAGECTLNTWESLVGQKMRSWDSRDETKGNAETFDFVFENGQYCTIGSKSGRNCYNIEGERLVHEKAPWISSTLKANGTIVWSHGYRSAPIEGDCKVDVEVYEDPWEPTCEINMDSWEGSYSWAFKTGGKPDKIEDEELISRVGPDTWCSVGTKSGYNCFKQEGDKFVLEKDGHKITANLQPNGDIDWSHGYTTRLWNPCRVESCNATLEEMDGMSYRTYNSWDAHRKTVDNFELMRRGRLFCTNGDVSGKNCYHRRGNVLEHIEHDWIKGRLQPGGDIKWSNGFTSRAEQNPCTACKVSLKDWIGKKTESFRTDDPDEKIEDNWEVYEKGDQWWNK